MNKETELRIEKEAETRYFSLDEVLAFKCGAESENERLKDRIYQIKPREGKHFPEGWSREEIITILFES